MINKLDTYFFIPVNIPVNVGLLWDVADRYGLEFVESGGCYSLPLTVDSQKFEYETKNDNALIRTQADFLILDEGRRIRMRQNWRHRNSGIQFSSTIAPLDVGGHVVHLTTGRASVDNDIENFIGSKHKQQAFWQDLAAGYDASLVASAALFAGGFRELFEQYLYPVPSVDDGWMARGRRGVL
ncbi:hypothetical protein UNDKW_3903 [Undibacterium sp. KW1]|nr:hypothetical protein UNDKW_3903 [Undibacterium sp. KW1]